MADDKVGEAAKGAIPPGLQSTWSRFRDAVLAEDFAKAASMADAKVSLPGELDNQPATVAPRSALPIYLDMAMGQDSGIKAGSVVSNREFVRG